MDRPPPPSPPWFGQLFDFQVNGFGGVDFQRPGLTRDELRTGIAALRAEGANRFFLTLITDEIDALCRKLENVERLRATDPAIRDAVVGYHLEGPWLNPADGFRGAHPAAPMHGPRPGEIERLQSAAAGRLRLVTLAPECAGGIEAIAELRRREIHVSLGHTDASEEQIDAAIAAGARFCTHLGNGTPLFLPRHDNVIQRLLARDELTACFIPDGRHVPPAVLRNFVRAKPVNRTLFTTDAMAGAGAGPGRYTLGELPVEVGTDGVARQPGGGGFAGSTLTPADGVRRTAQYLQLTEAEAARLWSIAALEAFGIPPFSHE